MEEVGIDQSTVSNKLLRLLSPEAYYCIRPHLSPIELPMHYKISDPMHISTKFVFPNSGVASVIGTLSQTWQELVMFGNEGAGSISRIISNNTSVNLIVMQVAGEGVEIDVDTMRLLFDKNSEVREIILSYTEALFVQISYTAVSNAQCTSLDRLSRWILMIQDRISSNSFNIARSYVAAMLGLSKASIDCSIQYLISDGLISYDKNKIDVIDRNGLIYNVKKYYGGAERDYQNIMSSRAHRYTSN